MGKKGVTFEEKRQRILKVFYERVIYNQKEVFCLKELENLGNKIGVISNTVKDVVQSLVDDNLVETDRIGIGNFLWALPSKGRQARMKKIEELKSSLMECKTQKKSLSQFIENQVKDKPDTAERFDKINQLKTLESTLTSLIKQRDTLKSCTKEYYDKCCEETKKNVDLCNKYTDDIFSSRSFLLSKNPSLCVSDINKHFSIPEELDSI